MDKIFDFAVEMLAFQHHPILIVTHYIFVLQDKNENCNTNFNLYINNHFVAVRITDGIVVLYT